MSKPQDPKPAAHTLVTFMRTIKKWEFERPGVQAALATFPGVA